MDKFQYLIMQDIILNPDSTLTLNQMDTFSEYMIENMVPINKVPFLAKKLFHKILDTRYERSRAVRTFMAYMINHKW